ncbi:hypothetical protein LIER_20085 [Lithospermum erythrorhizon]|uniref:Uncharacterized protein n=1 Tax=Lithospermum erythrorhizon TaxID=34254 RepID=A0AAV3QK87_LITER
MARRAGQEAADAEAAEDDVPEEVRPSVPQLDVSDEWLPENEPQGDNVDEEAQDSEVEDVVVVMEKRRKAKGKLRINENRRRIGNQRIPINVAVVPTINVSLNSEEEQAGWRFVENRLIVAEKMLSKVTRKNPNIMTFLEEAGVMPMVEATGPYYPKLVREFICNMTEDTNDISSSNHHKVNFRNYTFDFSPRLINDYFGRPKRVVRVTNIGQMILSKC